jgi:hypothetical protein
MEQAYSKLQQPFSGATVVRVHANVALVIKDTSEWRLWQWQQRGTFNYSRQAINPFVVDVVSMEPPANNVDDVRRQTGSGLAVMPPRFDRKPMLKLVDHPDAWVPADAHVQFVFV